MYRLMLLLACGLALPGCETWRWGADPERSEELARSASSAATITEPGTAGVPAAGLRPRPAVSPIEAALASPARLPGDRALDERRQAARLLRFFRIGPEMTVADLFAGSGYWSEAVSLVVGSRGRVISHNSPASRERAGEDLEGRFAGGRLANVEQLLVENSALRLPSASLDVVLLIGAYHNAYHADRAAPWTPLDGPALLREIHAALKPGGVLGVVDYVADPAMPVEQAAFLGRIDPARLRADIEAAGFVLESQSDMLRNPADDRRVSVFEPGMSESADRVALRFRKPEQP